MYPGHMWFGGWWMFPMIMPIVWIIVILIVLHFLFGRRGYWGPWRGRHPGDQPESSLEILKKRYAKGEITKDEFERIKKDLLT
jgi:putative membrane protein